MLARVSHIEAYRRWTNWQPLFDGQEEPSLDDLVRSITTDEPSEAMKVGTAFHAALEVVGHGTHDVLFANGYRFILPDADVELPAIREMRAHSEYGGLTVTGQVDGVSGKVITDHKTTSKVDVERYLDGCQWRFYLDLFDANEFRWNLFQIKEVAPNEYQVAAPQVLVAYRYPALHDDCAALAADYLAFAEQHLPHDDAEAANLLMAVQP